VRGPRWADRSDIFASAALLALSLVLFADVVIGGRTFYYGDLTTYFRGASVAFREIVLSGEFPSWNRFFSGGQPMAANPEFSTFYPLRYLILLPSLNAGWDLHLWIHIPVAAIGMFALLRSMELRIVSSLLGGVAFAFSGFFLSYISIPPFLFTLAWLPATLLFARKFLKSGRPGWFAAASASLGLQLLAGEPTTVMQTCMLIGAYAIYEATGSERKAPRLSRNVLFTILIVLVAVLVGAVQFLPMADHAAQTVRARGLPLEQVRWWSMPPMRALEMIFPDIMGPLEENQRWYWGRVFYFHWTGPYLPRIYAGVLPTMLALGGVIARVRGWGLYLTVAAGSLVLAAGDHTPLLAWLHAAGLFRSFRYPEKFILMAVVASVIFGAVVFDAVLKGDRRAARASMWIALVAATLSAALFAMSSSDLYAGIWTALWELPPDSMGAAVVDMSAKVWALGTVRGLAALVILWGLTNGRRSGWAIAAVAALVLDLLPLNTSVARRIEEEFFEPPPIARQMSERPGTFRLFHEADLAEQLAPPTAAGSRIAGDARYPQLRDGLYGRLASAFGFETILENDYDLSNLRPTTSFTSVFVTSLIEGDQRAAATMLRMSNVGFRIPPQASAADPIRLEALQTLPRYYFADTLVPIRTGGDFLTKLRGWRGSDRVAFIGAAPAAIETGRVVGVREGATSADVDVVSGGLSFLVASVTWDRYWSATFDGVDTEILRANLAYQGVFIPPGRHRVRFRYYNPLIAAGAAISAATLLGLALLVLRTPQAFASSLTARSTASGVGTAAASR
jgi:hypothetical protein